MRKRQYEDDGRTVADMSGVERPSLWSDWIGKKGARRMRDGKDSQTQPYGQTETLDRKERRAAIRGALGASVLIGVIYLAVFAVVIAALLFLWGAPR